jgi:formate hydrogenlyase transcriptional activator
MRRRVGRFELADKGTIFLDEVGELPAETQVLLLRTLQERVLERVGGCEPVPVDVRIIAATHRDLAAEVKSGRFRADLFYRLKVFPIQVPPLRQRREDISSLVRHFVQRFGRKMGTSVTDIDADTLRILTDYAWPGNVRELENVVERALIVSSGNRLSVDPRWFESAILPEPARDGRASFADVERQTIVDALDRCRGRIYGTNGAAHHLGLKPTTLYGKMRRLGIARRKSDVDAE